MNETEKQNILIVDDRPENLTALEKVLKSPVLNIIKATSGNDALALVLEHDFALVLLDVQMPNMDGFETAEFMRGNEETKHIPIIFLTAISKEQKYVFKGYESGAVDYLFKPLDTDILKSKISIFCELHRQKVVIKDHLREIEEKNKILQKRLDEIKTLRGLLPICASCKKIRNDDGLWEEIEVYLHKNSEADFSHGMCAECMKKHYPELADEVLNRKYTEDK